MNEREEQAALDAIKLAHDKYGTKPVRHTPSSPEGHAAQRVYYDLHRKYFIASKKVKLALCRAEPKLFATTFIDEYVSLDELNFFMQCDERSIFHMNMNEDYAIQLWDRNQSYYFRHFKSSNFLAYPQASSSIPDPTEHERIFTPEFAKHAAFTLEDSRLYKFVYKLCHYYDIPEAQVWLVMNHANINEPM